ncbi:MAG: hypothetical protein NTY97_05060 [Planctomycetota bacterium]|nr:hypothetical protein [Planctomycetota bacterium]
MQLPRSIVPLFFASSTMVSMVFACTAAAQNGYSSNPATPDALVTTANDDVQPKIAPAPSGGQYISYFSGIGYDVYVMRVDETGHVVWTTLVEDHPSTMTSTVDYGMSSDSSGNTYLAYNALDPVSGLAQFRMSSVDSSGAIRWSTPLYTAADNCYACLGNGRCVVASDGFVWAAHGVGFDSSVTRVNPTTGAVVSTIYITEAGAKHLTSGLQPSTDGAVLVSTVRYTTTYSNKILRVCKINSDGTYAWGGAAGFAAASTGNIQTGNFPDFISDGAGGGYLSWYTTNPLNCRVQHVVGSTGAMTFGVDGVLVPTSTTGTFGGTTATVNRTSPTIILGSDNRIYAFYKAYSASIGGYPWYGIGAQCFDSYGVAQWDAANGVMVEDYAPSSAGVVYDRTPGAAMKLGTGVGVSYVNYASAIVGNAIAARMNTDGTVAWKSSFASESTTKYRFVASPCSTGSILAWQANSGGSNDIFAGRINSDGIIGNPAAACIADITHDGEVNGADLAGLLAQWGSAGAADLNHDGSVDGQDLTIMLAAWGLCP